MRTGGDEGLRKLEHPSSLRLLGLEHGPLDSSTPQGEDLPSPLSSHNSLGMVLKRDLSLHCSLHVWTIFLHIYLHLFFYGTLSSRMTTTMSLPSPCWSASAWTNLQSTPPFLLTSTPTRMCRSRVVQRASRTVRKPRTPLSPHLIHLEVSIISCFFFN